MGFKLSVLMIALLIATIIVVVSSSLIFPDSPNLLQGFILNNQRDKTITMTSILGLLSDYLWQAIIISASFTTYYYLLLV